jgi:hypothetical protein
MKDRVEGGTGEELIVRLRSRSEFLKIMGAAGIGAAISSQILTREASALEPTGPTDRSFRFSKMYFLGYGTHGNFVVMAGPTWENYHEFPPR